ncbi:MAG: hypothetical protein E7590_08330 [Ruminococcaceae bacterium]|nr:hypothetical protein [Oscillospiraceae bacterium]
MRTKAIVTELVSAEVAVVSVERRAACDGCHKNADGSGCSICTLLGGKNSTKAKARNRVGAAVGDTVEVESRSSRILGYAALVFLLPLLLAFAGYLLGAYVFSLGDWAISMAFVALVVSFVPILLYSKLVISKRLDVEIVAVCDPSRDNVPTP